MIIEDAIIRPEEKMIFRLRSLYGSYGFTSYKMNKFEEYDLYAGNKDFLVSPGIITFTESNGRLMALKPDVTLSIAKNTRCGANEVQRLYYNEKVYRSVNGTFQEITQMGLEALGDLSEEHMVQVLELAEKSLAAISDEYVLSLSHPGLIERLLLQTGLPAADRQRMMDFLAAKAGHEIEAFGRERKVPEPALKALLKLLEADGANRLPEELTTLCADPEAEEMIRQLRQTMNHLQSDRVRLDFSIPANLRYYSGIVFSGYVKGIPKAILSGGRYDPLLARLGKRGKAIGFAIYLDLLEEMRR